MKKSCILFLLFLLGTAGTSAFQTQEAAAYEAALDSVAQTEEPAPAEGPAEISAYFQTYTSLVDALGMISSDDWQYLGAGFVTYRAGDFMLAWNQGSGKSRFSMENNGSDQVSLYGIYTGDSILNLDDRLLGSGWVSGYKTEGCWYYYSWQNGDTFYLEARFDDAEAVTSWYLCNWPEGDFSENFVGLENQQINGVPAQINVYEGEYKYELAYTGLDITEYYTVIVENVTDDSFDFTIYYADDLADTRDVVFRTHTAIFEGDGTYARYHGTEYNLEFTFPNDRNTLPDAVDMQISGYEPVEGLTFCHHAIPGHEFS